MINIFRILTKKVTQIIRGKLVIFRLNIQFRQNLTLKFFFPYLFLKVL